MSLTEYQCYRCGRYNNFHDTIKVTKEGVRLCIECDEDTLGTHKRICECCDKRLKRDILLFGIMCQCCDGHVYGLCRDCSINDNNPNPIKCFDCIEEDRYYSCDCGSKILKKNQRAHERTNKHINYFRE